MPADMSQWFPNSAIDWIFLVVIYIWTAVEIVNTFWIGRSRKTAGNWRRDRGSYWVIVLMVWGSIVLTFLIRSFNLGVFHNAVQYFGLGLVIFGIAFREWAVLTLGRFFRVVVTVDQDHRLIRRGPYRWLRHPSYTGSILTLIGVPLTLGTWAGCLMVLLLSLGGYLYRVKIEEKALLEALGDEYREYMQHTWRFFPGL